MIIIGVNTSHTATACLLKDGKILACISEERLTRVKNQAGIPYLAIKECLRISNLKLEDVDYLVLNYQDPKIHTGYTTFQGEKGKIVKNQNLDIKQKAISVLWFMKEQVLTLFPYSKYLLDHLLSIFYKFTVDPILEKNLQEDIKKNLGFPKEKILKAEHHDAHIYSAFYGANINKSLPTLIFTLDSMGDNVCATVSVAKNGKIKRISQSPSGTSIGDLYTQTTAYLGMKLGEHEYKVMGLAPYASPKNYQSVLKKIKDTIWINDDLSFGTIIHSHMFYQLLPTVYAYERFDNIAGALQFLTEDVLCRWIKMGIKKTGINNVVCAGGVFMNVKANQRIVELPEVKEFYVTPSASDESSAIGAAYWGYLTKTNKNTVDNIKDLYLGGEFTNKEIVKALKKSEYNSYKCSKPKNIEKNIAQLLAQGQVVARFNGRMEFGARALGNRSILAHPSQLEVISQINEQIKSRDFWMPFAPSILEEDKDKYLVNEKRIEASYMIITFDSTELGKDKLKAATHQYDHTLRPQIVYQDWNPSYYKIIKEFKSLTGIGAVLNTSFNLHGFPIVYTPDDALFVFKNSGLKYLALGPYLVSKKD